MAKRRSSTGKLEVQNAARTLFANIGFMSPDEPIKTIAVTSSVPNEGKTFVAISLATAIATSGKRVLIVEADMRRRTLAARMNVHPKAGAYALLSKTASISDAVTQTSVPNLYLLDVEPQIPNPVDVLSSNRFKQLVEHLKANLDYVIFDTPPVGTFVDAAILSTLVDGTIMVVKTESTRRSELLEAYDQLKKADARILGVCANFCNTKTSEYYYAYYNKAGEKIEGKTQEKTLGRWVPSLQRQSADNGTEAEESHTPPAHEQNGDYDQSTAYHDSSANYDSSTQYDSSANYDDSANYDSSAQYDSTANYDSSVNYDDSTNYDSSAHYDNGKRYWGR
ncbi:MAG: polysaccharide biosynthesis tyrosine autokinase [Coriobacteriia bacterium]|nr:polysaccharide biosynthesis tyrosine autokinase [Coriobacteriia bacterium]